MGISIISKLIRETCEVLWTILQPIEMPIPTENDWLNMAKGFFEKPQFPNTVAAVDGKHGCNVLKKLEVFIITTNTFFH